MTEEEKGKSEPRDYIILRRKGRVDLEELGVVQAGGASTALRKGREEFAIGVVHGARLVAVPVRNWTEQEHQEERADPKVTARYIPYIPPSQRGAEAVEAALPGDAA